MNLCYIFLTWNFQVRNLDAEWEDFTSKKGIDRRDLENWVDIAMASSVGSRWMTKHNRPLNKTNEAKDCPDAVKALWEKFVTTKENAQTSDEMRCSFEKKYKCFQMDRRSSPISYIMSVDEVIYWHGVGKAHIYFWFLFESESYRAEILKDQRLIFIFNDLELIEKDFFNVRSPAILFTHS
jgi:hypothetical protein